MGLIRKSLAPKTSPLGRGNLDVVLVNDPAVARDTEAARKALSTYAQERDPSVLQFVRGEAPTKFVLRALPHEAVQHVERENDPGVRLLYAFALSLVRIEGLLGGPEGTLDLHHTKLTLMGRECDALTDESLRLVAEELGELAVQEVGSVALQRARATANQKKAFSLPLGCGVRWEASTPATDPITQDSND